MLMRRVSAKEKVNNGLVRAALVAGVASAVAVGSLSGVGPANGTCIGISGININLGGGGGCNSTFGNFALGLGTGTVADASGGFLNGAIAVGTNVAAFAEGSGFSVANLALNLGSAKDPIDPVTGVPTGTGYSRVTAGPGFLNLAGQFRGLRQRQRRGWPTGRPHGYPGSRRCEFRNQLYRQPEQTYVNRYPRQQHCCWATSSGSRTAATTWSLRRAP